MDVGGSGCRPIPLHHQGIFQGIAQRAKHPFKWLEWTLQDLWGTRRNQKPRERLTSYCMLTALHVLYVDLVPNLETTEIIKSLKCFIAWSARPRRIYSDNAETFVSESKLIEQVMKDEKISGFLTQQGIEWKLNLSCAPWWGGQFERLIRLLRGYLYKTIGNGLLSWMELQEVLLDVEVALNNRPLDYVEDDIQLPILTPSSLLHRQPNALP